MLKKILFCLSVMLALNHTHQICAMEKDTDPPHIYKQHKPYPNASYELNLPFRVPHPDRYFFSQSGGKTYPCINGFEFTVYPDNGNNHYLGARLTCLDFHNGNPPKIIVIPKTLPKLFQETEEAPKTGITTRKLVKDFAKEGSLPLIKYLSGEDLPKKKITFVNFSEISLIYPILRKEEREDLLVGAHEVLKAKGVTFVSMKNSTEDPFFCITNKWLEIENSSKNLPKNSTVIITEFCKFFTETYKVNLKPIISTKNFMEAYKSLTDNCSVMLFLDILRQLNASLKPPLEEKELQSTLIKYIPKETIDLLRKLFFV